MHFKDFTNQPGNKAKNFSTQRRGPRQINARKVGAQFRGWREELMKETDFSNMEHHKTNFQNFGKIFANIVNTKT